MELVYRFAQNIFDKKIYMTWTYASECLIHITNRGDETEEKILKKIFGPIKASDTCKKGWMRNYTHTLMNWQTMWKKDT